MNNFFQIIAPDMYEYARFSRRGTWVPKDSPGVCKECGMTQQKRVPPLVIEWESDSDIIADFTWGGFNFEVVVRYAIAKELSRHFTGFTPQSIKMIESETSDRQIDTQVPKVMLPYKGPELRELWIDSWVSLDEKASNVEHEKTCSTCGFRFYKPKKTGLVLQKEVNIPNFFRVQQFPSWILCTNDVKDFIIKKRYSNITFNEVGEI